MSSSSFFAEPLLLQTQRCVLGKRLFVFRPMVLDLIDVPLVVLIGLLSDLNNQTLLLIRTFAILQYLAQNVGPLVPLLCIDYTQLCELLKSTTSGPRPSWPWTFSVCTSWPAGDISTTRVRQVDSTIVGVWASRNCLCLSEHAANTICAFASAISSDWLHP